MADWAAPSLVLLSLLVSHAKYYRYPLWSSEMLLCAGVLLLAGTGFCLLALVRRETLYPLGLGLLILIFLDVQLHLFVRALGGAVWVSPLLAVPVLLALFFAFMLLIFALRSEIGRIAAAAWGVIFLATLLLPSERVPAGVMIDQQVQPRQDLPMVLHLVLDEHIGVAGIPADLPGGTAVQRHLVERLVDDGFTLYGRAFSQYAESQLALASLVNGQAFSAQPEYVVPAASGYTITRNDWLRSLAQEGYSVRVYQSSYIDFCRAEGFSADYCFVYPANSISVLRSFELTAWSKARLILPRLFEGTFDFFPSKPQLTTLASPAILDRVAQDMDRRPRGSAFFVHLIWPHYAYAFDAQCALRPAVGTWANVGDIGSWRAEDFNSESERESKYALYFQQVRCVIKSLDDLLEQMRRRGSLADALIVIHGDHGSRLATRNFRNVDPSAFSRQDMVDHFSALMAIRLPQAREEAGSSRESPSLGGEDDPPEAARGIYVDRQESIQEIFAREVLNRPLQGEAGKVFVTGGGAETLLSRPMVELPQADLPQQ
ncbi:MAG TPA: hypothetical protein VLV83_18450 [Acidobacteriota bacterium]|nr:hypothetical protein [Acidobacteriota bacterium]